MSVRYNVADLNAIETRVASWIAECGPLLSVFKPYTDPADGTFYRNGKDPYLSFASKMYGIDYLKLWNDYKGRNGKEAKGSAKRKRQVAKPGVLGAVYRLSGGDWGDGKASYVDHIEDCPHKKSKRKICDCLKVYDRIRTGLWGYAHAMKVKMERDEAHMVVNMFRSSYPEICGNGYDGQMKGVWVRFEEAVADVMDPKKTDVKRFIGPNDCIMIDRLNIAGRNPLMRMHLPSGRKLHYLDAALEMTQMPWSDREGNPVFRPALWYANEDPVTGNWTRTTTHGGKLLENATQAIARDVLATKLLEFEANDMPVCGHVHDEGVTIVPDDAFSPTVEDMVQIMSKEVSWAPGLLLGADGFEERFYHK